MTDAGAALERPSVGWDAALLATSALTVGLVALTDPHLEPIALAALAVGACALAWVTIGRRAFNGGRGWWLMLAVLVGACLVGGFADPDFATFQVVAMPIAWVVAPHVRSAIIANAGVALAVAVGWTAATGDPFGAMLTEGISFGFSLVMGIWITRISTLSAERGALLERLTAAQEQVAALSREAGGALERERIARELHDTIAQSLTAIVMLAERSRARHPEDTGLTVLEESAREALVQTRGMVAATAPVGLDGGLAAALRVLGERFARETGVEVAVHAEASVPRDLEVVLLRCAQEGLANVRKHARAASVVLRLETDDGTTRLTVEDDGVGPAPDPLGDARPGGFGLAGMRDRLALVGGSLGIGPASPRGTRLEVLLPVERSAVRP